MAKHERIVIRVDETIKAQFAEAAESLGMSLSAFMISSAQELVARAQRGKQVALLSDRDRDLFLAALDRPVRPMPEAICKAKGCQGAIVTSD